jgi:RND superfamily putative drug exporter
MTLVPAFLTLLGEKSWCIPRWLDRLLPKITIEPSHDGQAAREIDVERPAEALAARRGDRDSHVRRPRGAAPLPDDDGARAPP